MCLDSIRVKPNVRFFFRLDSLRIGAHSLPTMTKRETRIVENFLGTLSTETLDEAMANAEQDARAYGLSRRAARELGARVRAHYARGTTCKS